MSHDGTTFTCGCAASFEVIFAAKELDELVEQDVENSSFIVMFRNDWFKYEFVGSWSAIAMATIKPSGQDRTVVAVSPGGAYWEVEPNSLLEVHGGIKEAKSSLRSLSVIDGVILACGMGRTVLTRMSAGIWEEIGPGISTEDDGLVVGFEDLAGFSYDEMYAVGWRGEIWQRNKGRWRRLDSPVSANLNALCCGTDGKVYMVGDGGVMLIGRDDVWEVLETNRTDNLMDVEFYANTVYVTTDFEILKLEDASLIAEDAFADEDDLPATCLHLLAADDALISMGTKDLFRLHENVWERLV
ncbi:hypothetical protein [Methylobacter sp.]|uniref:hypothetical protein n=1 Tax=Methylobacter sp. TaxID=2051955 RepID=UPI002FDE0728